MPLTSDDIWAELTRRRISARRIARNMGLHYSTVARVINGENRNHPHVLLYICSLIGVREEELAPGPRSPLPDSQHTSDQQSPAMSEFQGYLPRQAAGGDR